MKKDYEKIMDEKIPSNFIESTIKKLADNPERLVGVLHANTFELGSIVSFGISRNNSFGNAIESVFREIVTSKKGWISKPTHYNLSDYKLTTKIPARKKILAVDQVFSYNDTVLFIEQKIRDDHDTSKWVGQWNNFELKLKVLTEIYKEKSVIGVMWMIDNNFHRNEDNYRSKMKSLNDSLRNSAILCYGEEIDNIFNKIDGKNNIYFNEFLDFLTEWHDISIRVPDMNFDKFSYDSIQAFKHLTNKQAENFFGNQDIIEEIFPIIFPNKQVLKTYLMLLKNNPTLKEQKVISLIEKIVEHY